MYCYILLLGTSHDHQWLKRKFLCNKNSYHSKSVYRDRQMLSTVIQDFENNENVYNSANTVQRSKDSSVVDIYDNTHYQRLPLHDITKSNIRSKYIMQYLLFSYLNVI